MLLCYYMVKKVRKETITLTKSIKDSINITNKIRYDVIQINKKDVITEVYIQLLTKQCDDHFNANKLKYENSVTEDDWNNNNKFICRSDIIHCNHDTESIKRLAKNLMNNCAINFDMLLTKPILLLFLLISVCFFV